MTELSIIIPAYNQSQYLGKTINSVIYQNFSDFECIIIDDGSTDNTADIVKEYIDGKKIRYRYQDNRGLAGARNTGIRLAKGEYLHFLDSDDLISTEFIGRMIERLNRDDTIDVLTCGWSYIGENGEKISDKVGPVISIDYLKDLMMGNLFPVHAAVVRRRLFDRIGAFNEKLHALEDWDLWLRAAYSGLKFGTIDIEGVYYRKHTRSMTMNAGVMIKNLNIFLDNFSERIPEFNNCKDYTRIYQHLKILLYAQDANDSQNYETVLKDIIDLFNNIEYKHTSFKKIYEVIRNIKDPGTQKNLINLIHKIAPAKYKIFWRKKIFLISFKNIINRQ